MQHGICIVSHEYIKFNFGELVYYRKILSPYWPESNEDHEKNTEIIWTKIRLTNLTIARPSQ